jgi:hypothetical protein
MDNKQPSSAPPAKKVGSSSGSSKLPPVQNVNPQVETVSPATRLLEKRRLMYEKQEEYEQKKKQFKLYVIINIFLNRFISEEDKFRD